MSLSTNTIELLRTYINVVEPHALAEREAAKRQMEPEQFYMRFPVVYTTQRPSERLLEALNRPGRLFWEPQISSAFAPAWEWLESIDPPLRAKLIDSLMQDTAKSNKELADIETRFPCAIENKLSRCISDTVRMYLGLLFSFGGRGHDSAFALARDAVAAYFDPARCTTYAGCYLYNLIIDPADATALHLPAGVEIRASTYGDVVRSAYLYAASAISEGKYLPPAYVMTVRLSDKLSYTYTRVMGAVPLDDNAEELLDDTLTGLRLHQSNYVGRGRIVGWNEAVTPNFAYGRSSVIDENVEQIRQEGAAALSIEPYCLKAQNARAIGETVKQLRSTQARKRVGIAIERFNDSYRRVDARASIVDLVVALENLFGEETTGQTTEVGYRLRLRAARYIGEPQERKDLMKFFRDLYELRSKIVHGDAESAEAVARDKLRMSLEDAVKKTAGYLRIALVRMLQQPHHGRSEYLNSLLLGTEL